MTPLRQYIDRWADCRRCSLCEGRRQVVLCRGIVPCDVLFVGEAPGESEDALGQPFVGPAGHLMDEIVDRAVQGCDLTWAFTNLVCCIPRDGEAKAAEPPEEAIKACQERLAEFVEIAKPRLVVSIGALARDWLDPKKRGSLRLPNGVRQLSIEHPASILRSPPVGQGLKIQRCIVQLANAAEELTCPR